MMAQRDFCFDMIQLLSLGATLDRVEVWSKYGLGDGFGGKLMKFIKFRLLLITKPQNNNFHNWWWILKFKT